MGYWESVFQNAWGCTIGSILGIGVSYLIFLWSNKKGKLQSEENRIADEKNQLRAFALVLLNAIETIKKQEQSIQSFIQSLQKRYNEFPLLGFYPLNDLKRVSNNITVEKTGLTYMKWFPDSEPQKDFVTILRVVDYLYAEYKQLYEISKTANQNHYDRRIKFSDTFNNCIKLVNEYKLAEPQSRVADDLFNAKHEFDVNRSDFSDIEPVYSFFFTY